MNALASQPSNQEVGVENQKFKVTLNYIVTSKPACALTESLFKKTNESGVKVGFRDASASVYWLP